MSTVDEWLSPRCELGCEFCPRGLCHCGCGGCAPVAENTDTRAGYVKGEARRFIAGHHWRHYRANLGGADGCLASEATRGRRTGYNKYKCRCWKCTTARMVSEGSLIGFKPAPCDDPNCQRPHDRYGVHCGPRRDLAGMTFGSLRVVGYADNPLLLIVACPHGSTGKVWRGHLEAGKTTSCRNWCPICPAGHDRRVVGRSSNGGCRACHRVSQASYDARNIDIHRERNREYRRTQLGWYEPGGMATDHEMEWLSEFSG